MNRLLFGAIGAVAMYFLDPHSGKRRRARTRDKMARAGRILNHAGRATARDATQRVSGLIAGTRRLLSHEEVPDEVLVDRVRAALGRAVSQPDAIDVFVNGGHVSLSGLVLEHEAQLLLRCVRAVGGVRAVSDELTLREESSDIPSRRSYVSPAVRLATGAVGAGLLISATRAGGGWRALLGVAGGALLARSATNLDLATLAGFGEHAITVQKTLNIDAPPADVFRFWNDCENFPRFMSHMRDARPVDERRSRWTVAGPAGVPVHWTAEVVRVEPGELIEWCCNRDSDVWHRGRVMFADNGHGGTRVQVEMSYVPPAGAFGHAVASLFGADPKSEMDADLMRMKSMIESGNAPHDAARRAPQRES
ncbi:MAG TPA: SRPBCC family protein [Burkholderiales bacterium]|nr:SRPBCC family protein [Burkholderiales bacterium]